MFNNLIGSKATDYSQKFFSKLHFLATQSSFINLASSLLRDFSSHSSRQFLMVRLPSIKWPIDSETSSSSRCQNRLSGSDSTPKPSPSSSRRSRHVSSSRFLTTRRLEAPLIEPFRAIGVASKSKLPQWICGPLSAMQPAICWSRLRSFMIGFHVGGRELKPPAYPIVHWVSGIGPWSCLLPVAALVASR